MKMIEKLSLYLPYKLRGIDLSDQEEEMLSLVNNEHSPHVMTILKSMTCTRTILDHFKPIVRHPEDLTEEEIKSTAYTHQLRGFMAGVFAWNTLPYEVALRLAMLHVWLWPEDFENGLVIRKQR